MGDNRDAVLQSEPSRDQRNCAAESDTPRLSDERFVPQQQGLVGSDLSLSVHGPPSPAQRHSAPRATSQLLAGERAPRVVTWSPLGPAFCSEPASQRAALYISRCHTPLECHLVRVAWRTRRGPHAERKGRKGCSRGGREGTCRGAAQQAANTTKLAEIYAARAARRCGGRPGQASCHRAPPAHAASCCCSKPPSKQPSKYEPGWAGGNRVGLSSPREPQCQDR